MRTATNFNPRSSCEERPEYGFADKSRLQISIHAPHARSDRVSFHPAAAVADFNPRSSCEERLHPREVQRLKYQFQSTLLMRGATPFLQYYNFLQRFQSTLLMRGATRRSTTHRHTHQQFQSTLLMRGATRLHRVLPPCSYDFNPRSSCEERLYTKNTAVLDPMISIHAPHARSDLIGRCFWGHQSGFQSTLLMRGATYEIVFRRKRDEDQYFNPRSSCEERRSRRLTR